MKKITDAYASAWKQIVVPDKFDFMTELGPPISYNPKGDMIKRTDFRVKNPSDQTVECSLYVNQVVPQSEVPCLVYLHSHSGSRQEVQQIQDVVNCAFNICCFDFSGYGASQGEYSTLGLKEHLDLRAVVDHLREKFDVPEILLWGRSMGAVTAILFCHHHADVPISGLVLDSPFTEAKTMLCDLITSRAKVPRFLIKTALLPIASTIKSKTKFDVLANNPLEVAGSVDVPVFMFVGKEDKIARPDRLREMFLKFAPNKLHKFVLIEGEHNGFRDDELLHAALSWMKLVLGGPDSASPHEKIAADFDDVLQPGHRFVDASRPEENFILINAPANLHGQSPFRQSLAESLDDGVWERSNGLGADMSLSIEHEAAAKELPQNPSTASPPAESAQQEEKKALDDILL